jgi:hypothetical protein
LARLTVRPTDDDDETRPRELRGLREAQARYCLGNLPSEDSMYIGIGAVVIILAIVLLLLLFRGRSTI